MLGDVRPADVAPLLEWSVYFLDYRSVKRLISTLPAAVAHATWADLRRGARDSGAATPSVRSRAPAG